MRVTLTRADGIATITMDRPDKRNAMTDAMWSQFAGHLDALDPGGEDRVLVVTGAGGAFCGGSDVGGLLDDLPSLRGRIDVSNRCVLAMRELPIPTLAKVGGVAAGSGANLALACDLVYAAQSARFVQVFIHRGLSLDSGASWLLPRLVGERKALELSLLGDPLGAQDALEMGLISDVVPDEVLDARVAEVAGRLAASSPPALAGTKRLIATTWTRSLAQALGAEADNQIDVISTEAAVARITGFTGGQGRPS
ncbi:MAG: enoyl-CoA hydratase/isomerase family protein [Phycicoccus sp.]|nr:enoyl-CoA hydratase/isomerase family protein [Phycicoccus sp.]